MTNERGLTSLGGRDGRVFTKRAEEELNIALVKDRVGLAISKKYKINMRKAAYVVAVERGVEAMKLRGWV